MYFTSISLISTEENWYKSLFIVKLEREAAYVPVFMVINSISAIFL